MKNSRFEVGQTVVVNGGGVFGQEGVPKNCDGREARILKVGKVRLTVLIKDETFSRVIRMTEVRRIKRRKA
jgi:hypothetical protein